MLREDLSKHIALEWKFNATAEMLGVNVSLCDFECNNNYAVT